MNSKELFSDAFIKFSDDPKYSWQFKDCHEAWVQVGWITLIEKLLTEVNELVPEECREYFTWKQFKQKFGGLRAYYEFKNCPDDDENVSLMTTDDRVLDDKLFKLIDRYENISCDTCEMCSYPGKVVTINGYVTARCDEHSKETK